MSVKVRYRKIQESEYSIYLDKYIKGQDRETITLAGRVTNDYGKKPRPRFANENDKRLVEDGSTPYNLDEKRFSI